MKNSSTNKVCPPNLICESYEFSCATLLFRADLDYQPSLEIHFYIPMKIFNNF